MTTTLAAKPFDPTKYTKVTREQWQTARAWNDWGPFLRSWLGPKPRSCSTWRKMGMAIACSTSRLALATRPWIVVGVGTK